jgi:hypothetical protein
MAVAVPLSPPTGILPRVALLIEAMKRGLGESLGRQRQYGPLEPRLVPLADLLWRYLARTMVRLTTLHGRFAAGKLPAARRPAAARPTLDRPRSERRPPAIPPGPVFLQYEMGAFDRGLRDLLDDPEMRAFLAAAPQAGRLLRPLWRKLTRESLPEVLRLPRRPRPPRLARPAERTAPGLRPVASPDGLTLWEPTPCYPPWGEPPRLAPARAAELAAPTPPPAARPPAWGRPAPPAEPRRPLPHWLPLLFQR